MMAKRDDFTINGETVAPGSSATIALPVSSFASGMPASLHIRVAHGRAEGPTIFVSAAVHGDEIIGAAIIQRLVQRIDAGELAGTVIFAPAINIFGFLTHSRYLPDRRDLNRSFPGSPKGSLAGQVAHVFLNDIIDRCSLGIDIHSAAIHRYNLPQIRIAPDDPHLLELALAFAPPVIIQASLRPGSLREVARERGVGMLLMETGEALRFDRLSIRAGERGVLRVMAELGMLECPAEFSEETVPARSKHSQWVRAPRSGISRRLRKSGDIVEKDETLAVVSGLFGEEEEEVKSPIDGIIIGHVNLPVLNQGDAMFHIAEVQRFDTLEERVGLITDSLNMSQRELFEAIPDEDEVI
jgi:uncharacterized protein